MPFINNIYIPQLAAIPENHSIDNDTVEVDSLSDSDSLSRWSYSEEDANQTQRNINANLIQSNIIRNNILNNDYEADAENDSSDFSSVSDSSDIINDTEYNMNRIINIIDENINNDNNIIYPLPYIDDLSDSDSAVNEILNLDLGIDLDILNLLSSSNGSSGGSPLMPVQGEELMVLRSETNSAFDFPIEGLPDQNDLRPNDNGYQP